MTHPDYLQTLQYLYANLPMFQRVGAVAYKKDLTNTLALCDVLGNPHLRFKTIHVAGTNGKGSSSHMLAAVLQTAGYKTGLYTSPHLKEFTERIKVNGVEADQSFVVDFVSRIKPAITKIKPSFFEITVVMAFDYFARQQVDIAVIEVGLGGRLDSTNVITPCVSLITNIGYDHTDLLGKTLPEIAFEKAGIIKPGIPVVISQRQAEVEPVFRTKAQEMQSSLQFASDKYELTKTKTGVSVKAEGKTAYENLHPELKGDYQAKNIPGVLLVLDLLRSMNLAIRPGHIQTGIEKTVSLTGLKGRWQKLGEKPLIICDTGHNIDGIRSVLEQIQAQEFNRLFIVMGVVKDKDLTAMLKLLPKNAHYIFCEAKIPRALDATDLMNEAQKAGLRGEAVKDVNAAIARAKSLANEDDFIFIGGSTFVVAEIENL